MNKIEIVVFPQYAVIPDTQEIIEPERLICSITRTTMRPVQTKEDIFDLMRGESSPQLLKNLFEMGHGEPTRHANFTVVLVGVSRSFSQQWTRHHTGIVFTGSSQHYVDHSKIMDFVIPIEYLELALRLGSLNNLEWYIQRQEKIIRDYAAEVEFFKGLPKEWKVNHSVARQATAQAARNVLWFTANAQTIRDSLIRLRDCGRNTSETLYIADMLRVKMAALHPDIFEDAGPDCLVRGRCTQKHLSCGAPWVADKKGYAERWGLLSQLHEYELFKPILGRLTTYGQPETV